MSIENINKNIIDEKTVSTEALAYLGDCVLELKVRAFLVEAGHSSSRVLNKESLNFVKASAQARAMQSIIPVLTDKESSIFKRGRNMSGGNVPKSSSVSEYRTATGMEVLFGFLFLENQTERIDFLFNLAFELEKIQ